MTSMRSVPVYEETIERLLAYKDGNPLDKKTYDEAINHLMDDAGFPPHDELDEFYRQLRDSLLGGTDPEHDDSTDRSTDQDEEESD